MNRDYAMSFYLEKNIDMDDCSRENHFLCEFWDSSIDEKALWTNRKFDTIEQDFVHTSILIWRKSFKCIWLQQWLRVETFFFSSKSNIHSIMMVIIIKCSLKTDLDICNRTSTIRKIDLNFDMMFWAQHIMIIKPSPYFCVCMVQFRIISKNE